MGSAKLVRLLKLVSPCRKNVLFVEPCSLGHVPVASVVHPTPVFGGNPWRRPFWPLTPEDMRPAIVGIAPAAAYLSTRSGRIPSDANMITLFVSALCASLAAVAPPPLATATTTSMAETAAST